VESATESPRATFTITPLDGLTATVGLVYDSQQTMNYFFDDVDTATFMTEVMSVTPATFTVDSILDAFDTAAADSMSWASANYGDVAISLQVAYEMAMGDSDSITATVGLIYDTAYFNHVFIDKSEMGSADPFDAYIELTHGAKQVKNMDFNKDPDKVAEDIQDGYVWGYASVPIGVEVAVDMMGIEATLNFMTRLVNGNDVMNPDEGKDFDFTDPGNEFGSKYEMGKPRPYAMPMYLGLEASYEMDMGGMTIAPTANFKFSSDFFKIEDNGDDEIEYVGDVASAEYIGRQMSAGGGVDVTGISDMIDVSLSGSVGFGFGSGSYDWPFDSYYNAISWPDDFTKRVSELNKLNKDAEKALKDAGFDEYKFNNLFLVDDFGGYMAEIDVTATPIDHLTIENDFSYIHDGLGFYYVNDEEDTSLVTYGAYPTWTDGAWIDQIENETTVEYDIMVSDVVGCTLYGDFTFTKLNMIGEMGTYAKGWDKDTETFWIWDSEASTKNTFDYEIGVKVEVSTFNHGLEPPTVEAEEEPAVMP